MNFIKTVIAVLVAQLLLGVTLFFGLVLITALFTADEGVKVADGSWLELDIYGQIPTYDPPESIASSIIDTDQETLTRLLTNMEKAAADKRIEGVIMKVSSSNSLGLASMDELREAVGRVRAAGKPVIAYSDGLDRNTLYLASACDSIFMPDVSDLVFTGYGYVDMFAKGALDKLDVHQNLHKIRDYKTAAEMLQRDSMSPEAREMANWLIDEVWDVELGAISRDRGIPMAEMQGHMDHALFDAQEALDAGFIDGMRYWDELEEDLGGEDGLETISSDDYADVSRAQAGLKGKQRIAVVHAYGMIGGRKSRVDPSLGTLMGHETVIRDLRAAAEDKNVAAIIFRVDSRGGDALTSELISREVGKIAEDKPVIVSMGDVAASGGYAIAFRGTKIIADSLTITGSIGSIYGKINMAGLWNKMGVTFDWVTRGPNALLWSGVTDFDAEQWKRIESHHDNSFQFWLNNISEARGIPMDELLPLTEGRVWTGRQARERRLIDDVGGYSRAVEVAKEEAGIPADEEVAFVHYPKRRGLYDLITSGDAPLTVVSWTVQRWFKEDVAETARLLTSGRMRVWTGVTD
ncbi:MAG: S49 family peptidase [Candidatus Krumholzibacteria bacterium]|nr:S49 family peptidase [Candidatus Krumholzibacteria bacterium]MDH4335871.1 S49 family peptidase [Candidatus Krumholzibacteria bacterium]MDH5270363.1 S49 family peptidase [Candidatus Krumholzibacteria bacterium]MDH5626720.1 S49 family peptidase [Candidatus Krumholzibacteria bacterium]